MSDLEEVDVTKQIDNNDDEIQLSEPENDAEDEAEDEDDEGLKDEAKDEGDEGLKDEAKDDEGLKDEAKDEEIPKDEAEEIPKDEAKDEAKDDEGLKDEAEDEAKDEEIPEESKSNIIGESKQSEKSKEKGNVSNTADSSDSSDTENDDDDEELKKIEKEINNDFLLDYHPELKQINYKELLTLCKIVRNKKGNIIDPLHTTIPFLTRYEKAKILGLRAKQINNGADPLIDIPRTIIDGHTIALMELKEKQIPFIIKRPLPNRGNEYWKVSDLQNLE